jgi:hypothetical protein
VNRSSKQPAHLITTAQAQALYLFQSEGGLGADGCYIGEDLYGRSFCYDPWRLYARHPRVLSSADTVVFGLKGFGKSITCQAYAYRQAGVFGRQLWVVDPKANPTTGTGEWSRLASALGSRSIRLLPGGKLRLNPVPQSAGWGDRLRLLAVGAAVSLGRPPTATDQAAVQEALRVADSTANHRGVETILPFVVDALLQPGAAQAKALGYVDAAGKPQVTKMRDDTREVAHALKNLVDGPLRGMFDGPTTPGVDFDSPMVHLDISGIHDQGAISLLMAFSIGFLRGQMTSKWERHGDSRMLFIREEASRMSNNPLVSEFLTEAGKFSRSFGWQNIDVFQLPADPSAAGDAGTRLQALAENRVAEAETKIYHRLPEANRPHLSEHGLTDTEIDHIVGLPTGTGAVESRHPELPRPHHRLRHRDGASGVRRRDARRCGGMNADWRSPAACAYADPAVIVEGWPMFCDCGEPVQDSGSLDPSLSSMRRPLQDRGVPACQAVGSGHSDDAHLNLSEKREGNHAR